MDFTVVRLFRMNLVPLSRAASRLTRTSLKRSSRENSGKWAREPEVANRLRKLGITNTEQRLNHFATDISTHWRAEKGRTGRWPRASIWSLYERGHATWKLVLQDSYGRGSGAHPIKKSNSSGPGHPQISTCHCLCTRINHTRLCQLSAMGLESVFSTSSVLLSTRFAVFSFTVISEWIQYLQHNLSKDLN